MHVERNIFIMLTKYRLNKGQHTSRELHEFQVVVPNTCIYFFAWPLFYPEISAISSTLGQKICPEVCILVLNVWLTQGQGYKVHILI